MLDALDVINIKIEALGLPLQCLGLGSMVKVPLWWCPISPPVPPQRAPGGSRQLGTPRVRPRPLGAPPPPRGLERAAPKVVDFTTFDHLHRL